MDDPRLLLSHDDYEGAKYERAITPAQLEDDRTIDCWIYWYVGAATGRPVATGDWPR